MARQSDFGADSLDLLLDTICNVFGGIILMAILVVLQTQTSAGQIPELGPQEMERALEAQRLCFECERLQARADGLSRHREEITRIFCATTSPTGERLADAQVEFRKAIEEARGRAKATESDILATRKDLAKSEDALRTAGQTLEEKQVEVERLEEELRQAQAPPSRRARLPHQRGMVVGEAKYFMILGGRAYYVGYRHRGHHHLHVEQQDVAEPPPAIYEQEVRIVPRANGGFAVPERTTPGDTLDSLLGSFQPANDYFVFFVCNDNPSFAAFQRFKAAVVANRFHHVVLPKIAEGGAITVQPWLLHEAE